MTDRVRFQDLDEQVIRSGLCTHCGTCAGLSRGSIEMRETQSGPRPNLVDPSGPLDMELIFQACPGRGLNYPDLEEYVFGRAVENRLSGNVRKAFVGFSQVEAVRRNGASGGVITQILLNLLKTGKIDGAVVVRQGLPKPWLASPMIARTMEEITAASQSVYIPVPVNEILSEIEGFTGRLAYVGLPDQVASIRKLQMMGHPAAKKIEFILGPYVGTAMYLEAVRSFLRSNGVSKIEQVEELQYRAGEWPGYLRIKTRAGVTFKAEKFYYNYLIPFYITQASLLSVDFTNELTDISVGDAWSTDYEREGKGFSVVLARSEKGLALLEEMQAGSELDLQELPVTKALEMHGHMLDFKKRGAFIRFDFRRMSGKPVPDFGYAPVRIPYSRILVEVVISCLFALGRLRFLRFLIEKIPLRWLGPFFNWVRIAWKRISKPTKRSGLLNLAFREVHR